LKFNVLGDPSGRRFAILGKEFGVSSYLFPVEEELSSDVVGAQLFGGREKWKSRALDGSLVRLTFFCGSLDSRKTSKSLKRIRRRVHGDHWCDGVFCPRNADGL